MRSNTSIVGTALCGGFRTGCIAVSAVVALAACGQKGNLVLPTEAVARNRATLPQTLSPLPTPSTPPAPAQPASAAR